MNFPADPGGVFDSDVHRRVLGHLTGPTEKIGYTVQALEARMATDVGTEKVDLSQDVLSGVLDELRAEKLAVSHKGGIWQQTKTGHERLTGPIADEPAPGAKPEAPARIDQPSPIK